MTENKRFERIYEDVDVFCRDHNAKGISQLIERDDYDRIVDLLNELAGENQYLKSLKWNQDCINEISIGMQQRHLLEKEKEQLKQSIKEVLKLLEEEVDLFSDKATEHDINAYIELREFDNKDAYYMAISTKKAIKLLKEMIE